MLREEYKKQESWAAGRPFNFNLDFLAPALAAYQNPVVESLGFRWYGTYVVAAGDTLLPYAEHALVGQRVVLTDRRGDRVNASFRTLRTLAQINCAFGYSDMLSSAGIGAGTYTTGDFYVPLTFRSYLNKRPNDCLMTVQELIGCKLQWTAAPATVWSNDTVTISDGVLELQVHVREGLTKDAPSRYTITDTAVDGKVEDTFQVDGIGTRNLLLASNPSTQDMTSLATWTAFNSKTLRMNDQSLASLKRQYQRSAFMVDPTTNDIMRSRVIPFITPSFDEHSPQLPNLNGKCHLKFQAALPTGALLINESITPRDGLTTAALLGYSNEAELFAAMARGDVHVVTDKGTEPITEAGMALARGLPLRRKVR